MLQTASSATLHSQALAELRKESLDLYNRLHSIAEDIEFIDSLRDHYANIPIIPNLRCGAWYVRTTAVKSAYFKSTDGHFNNWSFNLRRPNIHLLHTINHNGGFMIVDSTRAGKRMPDALSKTVPLWCTVINRAIKATHKKDDNWDTSLYTPPTVVSAQEHTQMQLRLDQWAVHLQHSAYELPNLSRPLRPLWITPASSSWPRIPPPEDRTFYPIICVSASKQVQEGVERRSNGYSYVQGSGDDHELWSQGLTPALFWRHKDLLLRTGRQDLKALVVELVDNDLGSKRSDSTVAESSPVNHVGGRIKIGLLSELSEHLHTNVSDPVQRTAQVIISASAAVRERVGADGWRIDPEHVLVLYLPPGKRGQSMFLEAILPRSLPFIDSYLSQGSTVCISCDSGRDASVGVALAALQLLFDDSGQYTGVDERKVLPVPDKQAISKRLQWIIASRAQANPSRATLKRVNEFLMTPPSLRRRA
ncbi:initiator tRNA phosphoribosyl transferase [Trametopsis cervina]|nr:initiator tRNA phosphoribosyl transferase [Trametopsis cervina]